MTPTLEQRSKDGKFSGVVLAVCNGTPFYSASYGFANRTTNVKNSLDTRFNLGSMNKMWTAIAIAQLVEQKKIDVDAPVGRYLPDLTNKRLRDEVKISDLLTHTSGLGSYFTRGFLRDHKVLTKASDLLPYFVDDSLAFAPGSRMQYSNAGFALLGIIVERVSGMSYYDYMRKNILDRAHMSHSAFVTLPHTTPEYAVGYATPPGTTDVSENTDMIERTSSPAGGAFATAGDVVAFSRALWSGQLVGMPLVQEFTKGRVDMMGVKYAYGFGDGLSNGWRTVGHNGGAPGVDVDFISFPDHGIDLVVLTNIESPAAADVMGIAMSLVTGASVRKMVAPGARGEGPGGRGEGPVIIGPGGRGEGPVMIGPGGRGRGSSSR